jgi:hypothetical protein
VVSKLKGAMMSDNTWHAIKLEYLSHRRGIVKVRIGTTIHFIAEADMRRLTDSPNQPEAMRAEILERFLSEIDEGQMLVLELRESVLGAHEIKYRKWYYVTFERGHKHLYEGNTIDENTVAVLVAMDLESATERTKQLFGAKFIAIQSEQPDLTQYQGGEFYVR